MNSHHGKEQRVEHQANEHHGKHRPTGRHHVIRAPSDVRRQVKSVTVEKIESFISKHRPL